MSSCDQQLNINSYGQTACLEFVSVSLPVEPYAVIFATALYVAPLSPVKLTLTERLLVEEPLLLATYS